MASQGAQIGAHWNIRSEDALAEDMARKGTGWYEKPGQVFDKAPILEFEWAEVIQACERLISFDAVICSGPRHSSDPSPANKAWYTSPEVHISPRIATHAIGGCSGCGRAPEGLATAKYSQPSRLPLMAPPPVHSSTIKYAKMPTHIGYGPEKKLLIRCMDCLRNRYCQSCHKWWCEDCYEVDLRPNLAAQWEAQSARSGKIVKVHMGLCVETCLVGEMMSGAGGDGMWG